jgi:hypothetical protein
MVFVSSLVLQVVYRAHYSLASRYDAKIDTSRIKLANRDLAVLTPDESGWFLALRLWEASCRWNSQARAKTGQKSREWEKILLPISPPSILLLETPCLTA